jgi:glucose/arabinose dehydrogenase
VSRFTASGDTALAGSEMVVLELENLDASNHNGGAIHFGPDGRLYIATGENAIASNAQSLANRLGKILRINPDGTIPFDNPFYQTAVGPNRSIWALGLRNPFTFAFQPRTGRMFINDVGADVWEEIDEGRAGANYGWPICEGSCSPGDPRFTGPIHEYSHSVGPGCAITGGTFYNPDVLQFPAEYQGSYFFADACGDWIRRLDLSKDNVVTDFASNLAGPVDLKVSGDGSLYYLARNSGEVRKIEATNARPALEIVREQGALMIVWPVTEEEFSLQSTLTLPGDGAWTSVPTSPVVVDGQNKVIVTSPAPLRFYRLEKYSSSAFRGLVISNSSSRLNR